MIKPVLAVLMLGLALASCTDPPRGGQAEPAAGDGTTVAPTSQIPSGTTSPTTTATERPPVPASGRCTAAVLAGTVVGSDPAAGNRYAKLVVTNNGTVPCTLYGYGGFQLVAADGGPLPTNTRRDEAPGPSLVTLAPGSTAAKNLHWGVVPTGDEPVDAPCQPQPHTARIIPPDETEPFAVEWPFGPVCAAGTFHDSAYYQ